MQPNISHFPRRPRNKKDYVKIFKQLKTVHNFSFNSKRTNFTPQQKSAITRMWWKYHGVLSLLQYNRGIFTKEKSYRTRYLKDDAFIKTNKGIFFGLGFDRGTRDIKVKIAGTTRAPRVMLYLHARTEVFVPISHKSDFTLIASEIIQENKPDYVMLNIGTYRGKNLYTPEQFMRYLIEEIDDAISDYEKEHQKHPFTGIWLSWGKVEFAGEKLKTVRRKVPIKFTKKSRKPVKKKSKRKVKCKTKK